GRPGRVDPQFRLNSRHPRIVDEPDREPYVPRREGGGKAVGRRRQGGGKRREGGADEVARRGRIGAWTSRCSGRWSCAPAPVSRCRALVADRATAEQALSLWRGPPDFPEVARADAVRLEQQRLAARLNRIRAEIGRGHGEAVIPELQELAAAHPLDEPAAALL